MLGVVPVLPTVPFLALAAFCFMQNRLTDNNWLVYKFYQNNLADFKAGKG